MIYDISFQIPKTIIMSQTSPLTVNMLWNIFSASFDMLLFSLIALDIFQTGVTNVVHGNQSITITSQTQGCQYDN